MFRKKIGCDKANPEFQDYDPLDEAQKKQERTAYMRQLSRYQAIRPGKNDSFSLETPLFVDKKYAEPGSG